MVSTRMGLQTAYLELGISRSNTLREIRSAYRKLVRELHPDITGGNPEKNERYKLVTEAYEVVCEYHREPQARPDASSEATIKETREVHLDNFYCKLTIMRKGYESLRFACVLKLPLAYCERNVAELHRVEAKVSEQLEERFWGLTIQVIDERGNTLFESPGYSLGYRYERYLREGKADKLSSQLADLRKRLDEIPAAKVPAGHLIFTLMRECSGKLEMYRHGFRAEKYLQAAQELLRRVEREIERLEASNPLELAIEQLMSGQSHSTAHAMNLETVTQINVAAVRTGGFIEPYGEEQMREFYEKALEHFENPLAHLFDKSLQLDLEDFVPSDLLNDPELEAAPETVEFSGNKGSQSLPVTYYYREEQPTACIRLPLKVYERHAPEYGRPNSFPALPHGIVWEVEVEFDGRVVARGLVTEELTKKLDKWKRGKGRSKHAEAGITMGDMLFGAETSSVPPWYVGKSRPGRRK